MRTEKLTVGELPLLTELFEYNNAEEMLERCALEIQKGVIDIFGLYEDEALIAELRVKYESEDEAFALRGKRAYLYAFRVRGEYQGRGYGKLLLKTVLARLEEAGYDEFTVGVEDDNLRALHIYRSFGFNEFLLRKREEYQGDAYEYSLYLRK